MLNGEPAPGTAPGTTFSVGGIVGTQGNNGAFTFISGLSGGGSASPNNRGLWTGTADGLRLVVRGGDAAPETRGSFAQFQGFQGAGGGRIAFGAALAGAGVDATNDAGMWVEDGAGNTSLAWRKGDAAPGTDARLRSLREVFVNAEGRQAFAADVSGSGVNATNDEGIWFGDRGGYALVARKGDAAAGVNDGSTFASLTIMGVNALGQVAISARLAGDEVGSGNDYGIWLSDGSGQLHLVAREGGVIDVGNGGSRQITDLQTYLPGLFERSGGDDGNSQVLNDAGQLAFTAVTTDGAGVFVAMVPEPGTGVVLGAAVLFFWRGRRRR